MPLNTWCHKQLAESYYRTAGGAILEDCRTFRRQSFTGGTGSGLERSHFLSSCCFLTIDTSLAASLSYSHDSYTMMGCIPSHCKPKPFSSQAVSCQMLVTAIRTITNKTIQKQPVQVLQASNALCRASHNSKMHGGLYCHFYSLIVPLAQGTLRQNESPASDFPYWSI